MFAIAALAAAANAANPIATFETTKGTFTAEIFLDRVPRTASNFIDLARTGFYDGIHFHRVIARFMIQFGCPHAKDPQSPRAGTGGPPDSTFKNLKTGTHETRKGSHIEDENISRDSNLAGTLAMANTGRPNTGGSQFFVNVKRNAYLDWFSPGRAKHPVFGAIRSGMDVATAISEVKTSPGRNRPVEPIMMKRITISEMPQAPEALIGAAPTDVLGDGRAGLPLPPFGSTGKLDPQQRSAVNAKLGRLRRRRRQD
jgi:cyclophilin family peptidyl-prolyl cis-trans isomerase